MTTPVHPVSASARASSPGIEWVFSGASIRTYRTQIPRAERRAAWLRMAAKTRAIFCL